MVTPEMASAVIAGLGLAGGVVMFLYNRDDKHKRELEDEIESNSEAIDELDMAYSRMTQRLFGHPEDETDDGALMTRAERVAAAEEDIDSLSDEVQYAKEAAEDNGEAIEHLEGRVTEHAEQTTQALARIEEQLDESLLPEGDDFLRGDGGPEEDE